MLQQYTSISLLVGDPVIIQCNEEVLLNILGNVIADGDTFTVPSANGKTVVLENDLIIFGTLFNAEFLSNRALITLDNGIIDLTGGGTLQSVCGNYDTRGVEIIGTSQILNGAEDILACNSPTADDDISSTSENTSFLVNSASGVLDNDTPGNNSDIPGNDPTLSSFILDNVDDGSLTLNIDGSFDYAPDANFNRDDSFTYTVSDGNGGTDTADVTITVDSVNNPPVDFTGSVTDEEDGILSSTLDWFTNSVLIGTGYSITVSNFPEGVHVITVAAHDSQGVETIETITITIQVDLENQLFCDDLTIAELEEKANKGKYNLIDNRGNPSATLVGTDDKDLILAGNFGDIIKAKGGNDCVIGGTESDDIKGQNGNDEIFGLGGGDTIMGGTGNDLLDGGNGGDFISGGDGDDDLKGQAGNDTLNGEKGIDSLNGVLMKIHVMMIVMIL